MATIVDDGKDFEGYEGSTPIERTPEEIEKERWEYAMQELRRQLEAGTAFDFLDEEGSIIEDIAHGGIERHVI